MCSTVSLPSAKERAVPSHASPKAAVEASECTTLSLHLLVQSPPASLPTGSRSCAASGTPLLKVWLQGNFVRCSSVAFYSAALGIASASVVRKLQWQQACIGLSWDQVRKALLLWAISNLTQPKDIRSVSCRQDDDGVLRTQHLSPAVCGQDTTSTIPSRDHPPTDCNRPASPQVGSDPHYRRDPCMLVHFGDLPSTLAPRPRVWTLDLEQT